MSHIGALAVSLVDIGGAAQILSTLAVVVTVVYLSQQARAARASVSSEARFAVLARSADRYFENATSEQAPRIFAQTFSTVGKTFRSLEEALFEIFPDDDDRSRFSLLYLGVFCTLENQ